VTIGFQGFDAQEIGGFPGRHELSVTAASPQAESTYDQIDKAADLPNPITAYQPNIRSHIRLTAYLQ
jgi:hypothetical protein